MDLVRARLAALLLALPVLLGPHRAGAFHTADDRQTDFSAATLRRGQLRLGLFEQQVGIFNWWTVGTYTAPWLLIPLTGNFNGSLTTKFKLVDWGPYSTSLRAAPFFIRANDVSVGDLEDGDFRATIVPLTWTNSWRFDHEWTVSLETTWAQTFLAVDVETVDSTEAFGAGAQSNLQFGLHAEWRVSRVVALNLVTRYVPLVVPAVIRTTTRVDDGTTADVDVEVDTSEAQHGMLVQPGATLSWKRFNLQLGLGYGNLFLPGLRIVGASVLPQPDFDFYFRF